MRRSKSQRTRRIDCKAYGRDAAPRRPVGAARRPYCLFALRLPQLAFGRIDFTLRLLAKENAAELIALIKSGDELFL